MATGSSGSSSQSAQSSPTLLPILDDPRLGALFQQILGSMPQNLASVQDIVSGGVNSPLMAQILGPALARFMSMAQDSRTAVTDAARAAGGLRSTAYGQSMARNEGNILRERGGFISDTMMKALGPLLQATLQEQQNAFLPAKTGIDLLQASRPASGQVSSSTGFSSWGGGDGSGSSMGLTSNDADWLRRIGYQPTTGGGGGWSGVNSGGAGGGITQPAPNPYGGYGLDQGNYGLSGGGGSGSQISYGPWVDAGPSYGPSYNDYGGYPDYGPENSPYYVPTGEEY